jgi:putative radical SAM enzyme (TIGR03279 family)
MSMAVRTVRPDSPAGRAGLQTGDRLLAINGETVRDHLDLLFHGAEEELVLRVDRGGMTGEFRLMKSFMEDLGLDFAPLEPRWCGDDCVFCFVHQNPDGVRPSLMVQDEDFRLSFLHGNYITLDNLGEHDFPRILSQRLSPLYVSVHTTDPELRRRMLRGKRSGELLERMQRLLDGGIKIHTQVVLVPGWNDGDQLEKTVHDLAARHPGVCSVAIVPVGLTAHRRGLTHLRGLTPEEMRGVIIQSESWRARFRERLGTGFVYPADEFFLASGTPLPDEEWYEDFGQEENGVGMATSFVRDYRARHRELTRTLTARRERTDQPLRVTACTGILGTEMFRRHLLDDLVGLPGLEFRLLTVRNTFFGEGITIAGLLTARCFEAALQDQDPSSTDLVLLPSNCTNEEGVFLDDVRLDEFASRYPYPVQRGSYDLAGELILAAADDLGPTGAPQP